MNNTENSKYGPNISHHIAKTNSYIKEVDGTWGENEIVSSIELNAGELYTILIQKNDIVVINQDSQVKISQNQFNDLFII